MNSKEQKTVVLGGWLSIEEFMAVARDHARLEFSEEYCTRVNESRKIVEKCVAEERVVYGTTTGFGALVTQSISKEQAAQLQRNIVITHSTSVGEPFGETEVRGIMLMILQSLGRGKSGSRLELLERYRDLLNLGVVPYTPKEGSVGYLCAEAHIASVVIGEGRAYYEGVLYDSKTALGKVGLEPFVLSYKEGLSLTNGASSPSALAAIGIYDLTRAVRTADIISATSVEALNGLVRAYSEPITDCRPQPELKATAHILQKLLVNSEVIEAAKGTHVQDSLSLRCIPQQHGAVKRILADAWDVIETEINSCADNPIVEGNAESFEVYSNGNPDSAYLGLQMDAACIAATSIAKMSERRNARFLDPNTSGYPAFLVKKPGLNSGLMIPQYSQVGLLNDMRMMSTPSSIDSVSTSAGQEDYVAMGYNACKKSLKIVENLEYILAIELLAAYQAQQFQNPELKRGEGTRIVLEEVAKKVPYMEEDMYLYPYIEELKDMIHSGKLLEDVERKLGSLEIK